MQFAFCFFAKASHLLKASKSVLVRIVHKRGTERGEGDSNRLHSCTRNAFLNEFKTSAARFGLPGKLASLLAYVSDHGRQFSACAASVE